jgi:hypothetical protein
MSAFDDLAGTTLAAVSGVLGKLEYISHLRKGAGKPYSHWGLSRVYGEAAAQEALAEAHRLLFLSVLHTPLRELRNDTVVSSQATQLRPAEYVGSLRSRLSALVPPGLGGESVRQFSSVLLALSTLVSRRTKTLADTTDRV